MNCGLVKYIFMLCHTIVSLTFSSYCTIFSNCLIYKYIVLSNCTCNEKKSSSVFEIILFGSSSHTNCDRVCKRIVKF